MTGRGLHDQSSQDPPPAAPDSPSPAASTPPVPARHRDDPDDPTRQRRLDWATLLQRTFGLDVLCCPHCGSRMELIATIEDPTIARTILVHLGLPIRAPPPSPPWRPQPSLPSPSSTIDGIDGIDPPSAFD